MVDVEEVCSRPGEEWSALIGGHGNRIVLQAADSRALRNCAVTQVLGSKPGVWFVRQSLQAEPVERPQLCSQGPFMSRRMYESYWGQVDDTSPA